MSETKTRGKNAGPAGKEIEVISYSGYKGEESPRRFIINGDKIEVIRILDMWIEKGPEKHVLKRSFKVRGSDGYTHTIYYDEKAGEWFLSDGSV